MRLHVLAVAVCLWPLSSFADDVCAIRPDLCDAPTVSKPQPVAVRRPAAVTKTCRQPGASVSLQEANLPICPTIATYAPGPSKMSFEAYLTSNSRNPALNKRATAQQAFQENARPATYGLNKADDNAAVAAPSASSASATP
jgi:hypothetical protein